MSLDPEIGYPNEKEKFNLSWKLVDKFHEVGPLDIFKLLKDKKLYITRFTGEPSPDVTMHYNPIVKHSMSSEKDCIFSGQAELRPGRGA